MAQMTKEKYVAKVANRTKVVKQKDLHDDCGGEFIWSMVFNPRGRMMRVCQKCGTAIGKGN